MAILDGATFFHADLTNAILAGVNLKDINLTAVTLDGTNLTGADLRGANLKHSKLTRVTTLKDADLSGADFRYAIVLGEGEQEIPVTREYLERLGAKNVDKIILTNEEAQQSAESTN